MKDKTNIVVGVGLVVIICIVALGAWGSTECTNLYAKTTNAVDSLIVWQRDVEIKKLVKQLKAKQTELDNARAELASVNAKINNVKAELTNTSSAKTR